MLEDVITRVDQLGKGQGMPSWLAFADRCGNEIEDALDNINKHDLKSDNGSNHSRTDTFDEDTSSCDTDDELDNWSKVI